MAVPRLDAPDALPSSPNHVPLHDYLVLTPYLIPEQLHGKKVMNLGDGFILRSIERLLGEFSPTRVFSTRAPLKTIPRETLLRSRAVILAGANQLNDAYTVLPQLTLEQLRDIPCPLYPLGIGIHGLPEQTRRMTETTRAMLREVHRRIAYSSWRCPLTIRYLAQEIPEISHQLLMTGCPVIYDAPLLEGAPFGSRAETIAVTVTERGDFWDRELATLRFAAMQFAHAKRYLVLHQNFSPPSPMEAMTHRLWPFVSSEAHGPSELRRQARKLGYQVVIPRTADEALTFYNQIDVHIGSRLHAHLLCLSRAKKSFLISVDDRSTGLAEAFGFPLCNTNQLGDYMNYDFEIVREHARHHFRTMHRFISDSFSPLGAHTVLHRLNLDAR